MKRFISIILSVTVVLSVIGCVDTFALAAGSDVDIEAKIETLYTLPSKEDYYFDNNKYSNVGGLSVASAANKLYVVKINDDKNQAVIRYYEDLYTTKTPVKIYFYDNLLGHANGMAIDARYLYIIKQENQKQVLVRLKRSILNTLNNRIVRKSKLNSDFEGLYSKYEAEYMNENNSLVPYESKINAITKYSTNSKNTETSFIINYESPLENQKVQDNGRYRYYTIGTLKNGVFKVSKSDSDVFAVKIEQDGSLYYPDIFYSKKRGLFIPTWNTKTETVSYINCYGMKNFENRQPLTVLNPRKIFKLLGKKENNDYTRFEIESVSMIERNKNKVESDNALYLVFSVNTMGKGSDLVEKITNSNSYLKSSNFD